MTPGWYTKPRGAVAHYVDDGGASACADRIGPHGIPMRELFRGEWLEYSSRHHLCAACRAMHPAVCRCGKCSANRPRKGTRP